MVKQKEQAAIEKLMKLQKPASVQIDERVDARIVSKMDSTVIDTVQNILVDNLNPNAFKKGSRKHKKKQGAGPGDKKHKSGQNQLSAQQTSGVNPMANAIPSAPIIATNQILPSQFTLPTQRGQANEEQNIQYVAVPADQLPFLTFNEFRGGGSVHIGPARGSLRGRARHGGRGRGFTRNQGENDAYSMDVAPMNIFENQVIPMGLHNLSKSFKPNLATTRVFSLGTKFIPVWKKMSIVKPFSKFEDFRRRMSNKVIFEETTPGTFVLNKNFHIKDIFWTFVIILGLALQI